MNIVDSICVTQYLQGLIYFTNYRRFDANKSSTVDYVDFECVMANVVGNTFTASYVNRVYSENTPTETLVSFPYVTNNDLTYFEDVDTYSTSPRGYTWQKYKQNASNTYSIKDGNTGGTYNITPSSTGLNSITGDSPRSIIGEGNFHPATGTSYQEITGIVYVNGGTGFIVGDHEIATAAHMVLANHQFKSAMTVKTYNSSGTIQSTPLHVKQVHVPTAFMQITPSINETDYLNDYALIVVSENLSTSNGYAHFSIGSTFNARSFAWPSVPIYVTGKPDTNSYNLSTAVGNVYSESNNNGYYNAKMFHYTTDTDNGSSGAPVYTITKYKVGNTNYYAFTALAINTCHDISDPPEFNYGPLLTRYHRLFYLNNPAESYT